MTLRRPAIGPSLVVFCLACHGAGGREQPVDSTSKAEADAEADAGTTTQVGPSVSPVLERPESAEAGALEADGRHLDAASALEREASKLVARDRCETLYVAARLRASGGDEGGAARDYDDASQDASCELSGYARARAAAAYEALGKPDDALARATAVDPSLAIADETSLIRAGLLAAKADRTQAVSLWREYLRKHPRGPRWVDTALRLAAALLDRSEDAHEAFELATRVLVEAPASGDEAMGLRRRAALAAGLAANLSTDERVKRAHAFLDTGRAERARTEVEALLPGLKVSERCSADGVHAQALARSTGKKAQVADTWADAIRSCSKDPDALVAALFSGAKASAAAQRVDEAMERYARVEKEFSKHRLADDARLARALLLRERDPAQFETLLLTLPDDFPDGDMRSEALFRVALGRMERGDWEGAKAPLDRAALLDQGSTHWAIAGRAAYFRAKCAGMTNDPADARRRLLEVMRLHPSGYYMAQAYARLEEMEPHVGRDTLAALLAGEAGGPFLTREHPELQTAAFTRALALLEVGEVDGARKELVASGVLADNADGELVWLAAALFDRAGAPDVGHAFSRARLTDHLGHYPSGRWRFAWEAAYPKAFDAVVTRAAQESAVPAALVWGVMREESAFLADARSPSNALGLMQLLPSTARELARGTAIVPDEGSLHQPAVSVALGTKLLSQLRSTFRDNPSLAIASYNAGMGAVGGWLRARPAVDFDLWVELIPFDETRGYVKRVLSSELAYALLYAPEASKEVLALPERPRAAP